VGGVGCGREPRLDFFRSQRSPAFVPLRVCATGAAVIMIPDDQCPTEPNALEHFRNPFEL